MRIFPLNPHEIKTHSHETPPMAGIRGFLFYLSPPAGRKSLRALLLPVKKILQNF